MKKLVLAAALSTLSTALIAADTYTFDARHTYPVFEVNHLGFSTQRGRFNKTSGKLVLNTTAKSGSVEASIDTASIDMGAEDWDKHMRGEDFFNSDKHPKMSFKSTKLVFEGDKPVAAEGNFTLLGVTKPVKLAISNFKCGEHPMNKIPMCAADVSTTIKRSEFGMTKYVPAVGDEVKIMIPVEALKDED